MLKSDPNLKEFIDFVSTLQFQIVQKAERSSTPENPEGYISYFDLKCNNLFHEEFIQKTNSYVINISNQIEEFTGDDYQELENINKYIISQKKYLEKGYVNQTLIQYLDTKYLHYEITDFCTPIEKPIKNESDYTDIILKSCQSLINKIESLLPEELDDDNFNQQLNDNKEKIVWNGTVSDLVYFMLELNKKGWLELKKNNQNNFSTTLTAKLLISHFKIYNGKDIELKSMSNSFGLDKLQASIDRLENELIVPLKN